MAIQRACYVNCGLPDDQCACYRDNKPPLLYDPMPRQDLRVGPDTITLPRAEVEALMDLLRRAKHCIGDNYLHWQGESDVALATLQERMK